METVHTPLRLLHCWGVLTVLHAPQVDMDDIRTEQDAALERAKDAVASALAAAPDARNGAAKRSAAGAPGAGRPAKKQRPGRVLGNVLPSDSEDEEGVQPLSTPRAVSSPGVCFFKFCNQDRWIIAYLMIASLACDIKKDNCRWLWASSLCHAVVGQCSGSLCLSC